jgi:hypothetical protein
VNDVPNDALAVDERRYHKTGDDGGTHAYDNRYRSVLQVEEIEIIENVYFISQKREQCKNDQTTKKSI